EPDVAPFLEARGIPDADRHPAASSHQSDSPPLDDHPPAGTPNHPGVMKPPGGFDPGQVTAFNPASDGTDHAHAQPRRPAQDNPATDVRPSTSAVPATHDGAPDRAALQARKALADAVGVEPTEVTHGRVREALRTVAMELRLFDDADWSRALIIGDLPGIRGWVGDSIAQIGRASCR